MDEQGLLRSVELRGLGERWVKREEASKLRPAAQILGEGAAHTLERRITRRRNDRQPIGGAALDDEDEAPRGVRAGNGHARQSKRRKPGGRTSGGEEEAAREHAHLLTNSGLTSSNARPSAGLSARAIAVLVGSPSDPGRIFSASARGSTAEPVRSAIRCATS